MLPAQAEAPATISSTSPRRAITLALWLLPMLAVVLYAAVVYRTAWLAEDAYIAFRTVDNFVHGRGLTWNPGERVQTYTCPLYVLLYSPIYAIAKEPFYSAISFLAACSLAAVGLVVYQARRSALVATLAVLILSCSKAFTDYSTSGLENPVSHLLLAGFFVTFFGERPWTPRRLLVLSLLAALTMTNRLDLALIVAPCLLWAWWKTPERFTAGLGAALLGSIPLVAWELFSLVYYGFPVPNTAFGKLNNGIPDIDLFWQGLKYFRASVMTDPVTVPVILLGIFLAVRARTIPALAAAAGILLYLVYTVRIGGDYMVGRFLTAPLLVAVMIVATCSRYIASWWAAAGAVLVLLGGVALPHGPLLSDEHYGETETFEQVVFYSGIADERAWYYKWAGLMPIRVSGLHPRQPYYELGQKDSRERDVAPVHVIGNVGFRCYYGGPTVHYLDVCGLGDALTARLPPMPYPTWRIGHFVRPVPAGYFETCVTGQNQIRDPGLFKYYDILHEIIAGPIFSSRRIKFIVRMNLGHYESLIDKPYYRNPDLRTTDDYKNIPNDGLGWRLRVAFPPPYARIPRPAPATRPGPVSAPSPEVRRPVFSTQAAS